MCAVPALYELLLGQNIIRGIPKVFPGEFVCIQAEHARNNGLEKPLTHLILAGGLIQAIDNRDEEVYPAGNTSLLSCQVSAQNFRQSDLNCSLISSCYESELQNGYANRLPFFLKGVEYLLSGAKIGYVRAHRALAGALGLPLRRRSSLTRRAS